MYEMFEKILLSGCDIHHKDAVICDLRRHVPWHRNKPNPVYQVYNNGYVEIFNDDFLSAMNKFNELRNN